MEDNSNNKTNEKKEEVENKNEINLINKASRKGKQQLFEFAFAKTNKYIMQI